MRNQRSVIVISITPFHADGSLDEGGYRAHLRRLAEAGVTVYVAGSGTSEAYTFTREERERVLDISVEELKGKVPVRAMGCEPRTANEMLDYLRAAEKAKVDAAQIFSLEIGHGTHPSPAEMELYYDTVISQTDLPVIISTHRVSGYIVPLDVIERMAKRHDNVLGVAYGGLEIPYLGELVRRLGDRLEIHCAGPANAMASLSLGANGFMGGEGNFAPHLVASVIKAYDAGDQQAVTQSFGTLMAFAHVYNRYGAHSARGLKPLMQAYGLPSGPLRPPRLPITDAELKDMLRQVALLDIPGIPAHPQA